MKKIKTGSIIVNPTDLQQGSVGDSIEDRSIYLRSDDVITWTGTQLEFTTDIILEIINSADGNVKSFTIALAQSPVALSDGESAYISIDRTTSGAATIVKSGTVAISAHSITKKDIFVLFRRKDTAGAAKVLHIPLHKQALEEGQSVRLGASGGGGAGGGSLDFFYTEDFETTASADLTVTGTWTKADNEATQISGDRSIKMTQASGSSGAQVTAGNIELELNQKDTTISLQGRYLYDGDDNDVDFVIYDVTNTAELSRIALPTSDTAKTFRVLANTLSSTANIKWYFEVAVENIGAILEFDNIEGRVNPLPTVESIEIEEARFDTHAGYGSTNTVIPYFTNTRTNTTGNLVTIDNSSVDGLSITANGKCIVNVSWSANFVSANSQSGFSLNSSQLTTAIVSITTADRVSLSNTVASNANATCSVEIEMNAGDILRPHGENQGPNVADRCILTVTATASSASVVFEGIASEIESALYQQYTGYSSSNTAIPYFTTEKNNTVSKTGVISNSSTDGWSFTASKRCKVSMSLSTAASGGTFAGIDLNGAELSTNVNTLTDDSTLVAYSYQTTSNSGDTLSFNGILEAGDVLRPHLDKAAISTDVQRVHLSITATPAEKTTLHSVPVTNERLNSIALAGNDARTITVATEDVHFSGSGVGWTSTGDTHYYTIQRNGSVIQLSTSLKFGSANRSIELTKNGTFYKRISLTSTNITHKGEYTSSAGEFVAGDQLSIRVDGTGGTLQNNTVHHYLSIVENYEPRGYFLGNLQIGEEHGHWHTHSAYASTNTMVPRMSIEVSNTISEYGTVDYSNTTDGFSFTALVKCKVNALWNFEGSGAGTQIGWTLNSAELTTALTSITNIADRLSRATTSSAGHGEQASTTIVMNPGDVLRPHGDAGGVGSASRHSIHLTVERR